MFLKDQTRNKDQGFGREELEGPVPLCGAKVNATMSGGKKAKASKASAEPALATLAARLSREDIEDLFVRSIQSGDVSRQDVLERLSELQQCATLPRQAVGVGSARTGTGRFDLLADDILIPMILGRVPCEHRCMCAISVCKGWRALKENKELWREIAVGVARGQLLQPWLHPGPPAGHILRFVAWLDNPADVTSLSLATNDSAITPDVVKQALSALPALTSLNLVGKKITCKVLTHMVQKLPWASNLTTLALESPGRSTGDSKQAEEVCTLLAAATRLTALSLSNNLAGEHVLRHFAGAHRRSRDGGTPLLSRLTLTGAKDFSPVQWSTLAHLGTLFPELEYLEMRSVAAGSYFRDIEAASPITTALGRGISFSVAPLPRLRHLIIGKMAAYNFNMHSAECDECVRGTLAACTALTHLDIAHGLQLSGPKKPPCQVSRCFDALPTSITALSLSQLTLASDALAVCALPELRSLTLEACGLHAPGISAALGKTCPRLHRKVF